VLPRRDDGDIVNSVMLCSGVHDGGEDSCEGDSGGPIFYREGKTAGKKSPGIYLRASDAKDLIDATMSRRVKESCLLG
jgi:secreted trypsin-like serine protease